jgi:hypothetical protein
MNAAKGSIRQRGTNSFELRAYGVTDPLSGKNVDMDGFIGMGHLLCPNDRPMRDPAMGAIDLRWDVVAQERGSITLPNGPSRSQSVTFAPFV